MKTLYESILDDNAIDNIQDERLAIRDWLESHDVMSSKSKYIVNKNGEIELTGNSASKVIYLGYNDYDELPPFIKFADDADLDIYIGCTANKSSAGVYYKFMKGLKSFAGLPKVARLLQFKNMSINGRNAVLPPLSITLADSLLLYGSIVDYGGMNVTFTSGGIGKVKFGCSAPLKNIHIKNAKVVDMVNDFNLGDEFSKQMIRKAEMNKYKHKYETPITDAGEQVIKTFFDGTVDISTLKEISYTQNSQLLKFNGKWYRFKNWTY